MSRTSHVIAYLLIAGAVVGVDLWTKVAVFELLEARVVASEAGGDPKLTGPGKEHSVIDGFFALQAAINYGAFNGLFSGMKLLLLSVSALWVIGTFIYVLAKERHELLLVVALALTAGGAFGNFWDRYFYGAVRDFIKWYVVVGGKERIWPNFNIADACICTGVGLILLREFLVARRVKRAKAASAAG